MQNYTKMLHAQQMKGKLSCVGLDSDHAQLPQTVLRLDSKEEEIFWFNREIIERTKDSAGVYKLNFAFYIAHLHAGLKALERTINHILKNAPDVPIILDCKDCDIGNTNNQYVEMITKLGVHAVTVNPYLGEEEGLEVFLEQKDLGVIVLCKTSNKGSAMFQDQMVRIERQKLEEMLPNNFDPFDTLFLESIGWDYSESHYFLPMYHLVALQAMVWNRKYGNVSIVVGATYAKAIAEIRALVGDLQMLIPGAGKGQGGDAEACAFSAADSEGIGFLINSSRGIIFASNRPDFAQVAAKETLRLNRQINAGRTRQMLERTNAVLTNDHFVYAAGDHGDTYINKDAVFVDPVATAVITFAIALDLANRDFEVLVGPAMGGAKMLQSVAFALYQLTGRKVSVVHADKVGSGNDESFEIRRGYEKLVPNNRVVIIEDVINSGSSVSKVIEAVQALKGVCKGVYAIVNRGGVKNKDLGVPYVDALLNVELTKQKAESCTLCVEKKPINQSVGHGKQFMAAQTVDTTTPV